MKFSFSIPILLTCSRIILTPFIVVALMCNYWLVALVLFCSAALTDFLDGYYARLLNQETVFGAMLDPVADKFLLLTTFFVVACKKKIIPWWFFIFICVKEIVIILGALWLGVRGRVKLIKPTMLGKISTCVQIAFLLTILCCQINGVCASMLFSFLFMLMVVLIALSLIHYVFIGIRLLL